MCKRIKSSNYIYIAKYVELTFFVPLVKQLLEHLPHEVATAQGLQPGQDPCQSLVTQSLQTTQHPSSEEHLKMGPREGGQRWVTIAHPVLHQKDKVNSNLAEGALPPILLCITLRLKLPSHSPCCGQGDSRCPPAARLRVAAQKPSCHP